VPAGLEQVAMRALARDPARRFQDAGTLAEAVEDLARSEGLRSSRADLGAHVRKLFPDRAALAIDAPGLDQLSGPAELDAELEASSSLALKGSPEAAPAVESARPLPPRRRTYLRKREDETAGVTQALKMSALPRRRAARLLTGALVVGIAGTIGVVAGLSLSPEPGTSVAGVTVAIVSEPPGAEVLIEGRRLGRTPIEYAVGSDAPAVRAQFRLEGYRPVELSLSAKSAPRLWVPLRRLP
jgi:hypothetical protein